MIIRPRVPHLSLKWQQASVVQGYMTNKIEFAASRRISSVWTLVFRRVEDGIEILAHSRDIDAGYELERQLPDFRIIETEGRVASAVEIGARDHWSRQIQDGETLKVVNPSGVFSYDLDKEWIDKYPEKESIPAAACQRCGGWTGVGGMSQFRDAKVPVMGRIGCTCYK